MANLRLSSDQAAYKCKVTEEVALSVLNLIYFTSVETMQSVVDFVNKCKAKNTMHLTAFSMARIAVLSHGNPLSTNVQQLQKLSLEMFLTYAECRVGDSMCGYFARQWCKGRLGCPSDISAEDRIRLEKISSYVSPAGYCMAIRGVVEGDYSAVALGSLALCIPLGYCLGLVEMAERAVVACAQNNENLWEAYALVRTIVNDGRAVHTDAMLTRLLEIQPELLLQHSKRVMGPMHTEYCKRHAYYLLHDHARRSHKTFTAQQMEELAKIAEVQLSDCLC